MQASRKTRNPRLWKAWNCMLKIVYLVCKNVMIGCPCIHFSAFCGKDVSIYRTEGSWGSETGECRRFCWLNSRNSAFSCLHIYETEVHVTDFCKSKWKGELPFQLIVTGSFVIVDMLRKVLHWKFFWWRIYGCGLANIPIHGCVLVYRDVCYPNIQMTIGLCCFDLWAASSVPSYCSCSSVSAGTRNSSSRACTICGEA